MKHPVVITIVLVLLMIAGCSTFDHSWSLKPPASKTSPWHRVLPEVAFSNAPLPDVLIELERLANSVAQPEIKLSLCDYKDSVFDHEIPRVSTFRALEINLQDTIRLIGDITEYEPIYGRNEVIFVRRNCVYGTALIQLEGRCLLRHTGLPVKRLSLICTRVATFEKAPETSIYDVSTDGKGFFSLSVPVSARFDVAHLRQARKWLVSDGQPSDQRMEIIVISDACYPTRTGVDLVREDLHYRLEIEMEQ